MNAALISENIHFHSMEDGGSKYNVKPLLKSAQIIKQWSQTDKNLLPGGLGGRWLWIRSYISIPPIKNPSSKNACCNNRSNELFRFKTRSTAKLTLQLIEFWNVLFYLIDFWNMSLHLIVFIFGRIDFWKFSFPIPWWRLGWGGGGLKKDHGKRIK